MGWINYIPSICSDNGLAPARWQIIIWTNGGLFYWRKYASLGLDEILTLDKFSVITSLAFNNDKGTIFKWFDTMAAGLTVWLPLREIYDNQWQVLPLHSMLIFLLSWWWPNLFRCFFCGRREGDFLVSYEDLCMDITCNYHILRSFVGVITIARSGDMSHYITVTS